MTLREQTWVLTGAAGRIATCIRPAVAERVASLLLTDVVHVPPTHPNETSVTTDLRDQSSVESCFRSADGVLHLGGISDEADFHDLAEVNIVGTYHVLEAARRSGVRRVVYASSNRTTGFYSTADTVDPQLPVRPDGLYGVSKVAGEALGQLYADKFGLEVANLRIGSFGQEPGDERQLSTWLSPADCIGAFLAAMTVEALRFTTFYAVSRNTRCWWDLTAGYDIGFEPQDDAERYAGQPVDHSVAVGPQGGRYATPQYTLERQRR